MVSKYGVLNRKSKEETMTNNNDTSMEDLYKLPRFSDKYGFRRAFKSYISQIASVIINLKKKIQLVNQDVCQIVPIVTKAGHN